MKGYGQKRYFQKIMNQVEKNDPSTTNIVLNGFDIVDAKLAVLAMALVNNTHVISLHLNGNSITDHGAKLLAYTLQQNKTIELVSLNDNRIRSAGAEAIAAALYYNNTLQVLRLENNQIGNSGGKKLRKMMRHNKCINELSLDGNKDLSPKIIDRIDERCKIQCMVSEITCDIFSASSDFTPYTATSTSSSEVGDSEQDDEKNEEMNEDTTIEWHNASSSTKSLFGASGYMNDEVARKFIIRYEEQATRRRSSLESSWNNNLASYMMKVQSNIIDKGTDEKEEGFHDESFLSCIASEHEKVEVCHAEDLTITSEKETREEEGGKQTKTKWSLFKKGSSKKKIHAQE